MGRRLMFAVRDWFLAPQPIYALVAARVIFGGALFFAYLVRLPWLEDLYGPTGLPGPELFPDAPELLPVLRALAGWIEPLAPEVDQLVLSVLYALLLVASAGLATGCYTRTSGIIAIALHLFLARGRSPLAYWGWATHIHALLIYVVAAPTGRFLSVDAWRDRRRTGLPPPPAAEWVTSAWPLRLLQINTCAMYLVSGFERLDSPGWYKGRAVFVAMVNSLHSKLAFDWSPFKPLLALATWSAFVLEPVAPVLLWLRRAGPIVALLLIGMHVALELLTNVGWWNFIMIASLLAFLPSPWLERVFRKLPGGPSP